MTETPFFRQRIPIAQLLIADRKETLDRALEGYNNNVNHFHQVMVLAAGIAGVVVPILFSQSPALANPWFLRRAVVCFGLCIGTGVLYLFVGRWVMAYVVFLVTQHYAEKGKRVGEASSETEISKAIASADEAWIPKGKRITGTMLTLTFVGDVLFYGPFLRGIAYLIESFVM